MLKDLLEAVFGEVLQRLHLEFHSGISICWVSLESQCNVISMWILAGRSICRISLTQEDQFRGPLCNADVATLLHMFMWKDPGKLRLCCLPGGGGGEGILEVQRVVMCPIRD